jgi:hypothetical protein
VLLLPHGKIFTTIPDKKEIKGKEGRKGHVWRIY